MSEPVNVVVLIHGITPERDPSPAEQYRPMIEGLRARGVDSVPIGVVWGVPGAGGQISRPDQRLNDAEHHVSDRVRFENVRADPSPHNEVMMEPLEQLVERHGIPLLRGMLTTLREQFVQFGLADAVYYASAEGEHDVRHAVYGRVLGALEEHADAQDVRLHIVPHSLGVTVAHDFLYGLFAPEHEPDFARGLEAGAEADYQRRAREHYASWRARADAGRLTLGTFVSLASQLPLTLLRKRELVQRFFDREPLDPRVLGVAPDERRTRWAIFYDIDDVLGFATRRLYREHAAIKDVQIQTGIEPLGAHLGYWSDEKVLDETARLIRQNGS